MTTDQGGISGGTPGQDRAGSMRPDEQQIKPGRDATGMGDAGGTGAQGNIGGAGVSGGSDIGAGGQLGRTGDADLGAGDTGDAGDVGDLGGQAPDVLSEEDLTGDVGDDDETSGPMGGTIGG